MANVFDMLMDPTPIAEQGVTPAGLGGAPGVGVRPAVIAPNRPPLRMKATPLAPQPDPNAPDANGPPMDLTAPAAPSRPGLLSKLIGQPASNYIGDVAAGMTAVPAGADPISAFAFGLSGARAATANRIATETATANAAQDRALAMEDRTYKRGQDTLANARADRALNIDEMKAGATSAKNTLVDPKTGLLTQSGDIQVYKLVGAEDDRIRKQAAELYTAGEYDAAKALMDGKDAAVKAYEAAVRKRLTAGQDPEAADYYAHQEVAPDAEVAPPPLPEDTRNPFQKIGNAVFGGNPGPGEPGYAGGDSAAAADQPQTSAALADIPPPPPSVPPGSQYNPARKLWRTPEGAIYDENGNTVSGQ